MSHLRTLTGQHQAQGLRIALIAARFNALIVERLIKGAVDSLTRVGADTGNMTLIHVPGAFEIPLAASRAASSGRFDVIVTLGTVIRGETPHFDYVCGECAAGVARVMEQTGVPIGFGVLTVDTTDQALARAGAKAGNKGEEAAMAAIELHHVLKQLSE